MRFLERKLREPTSLHRFPEKMVGWLIDASRRVVERYGGKPSNIWNDNPRAGDLQHRFDDFEGIGQKKSSMATNILVRDFRVRVRGLDYSGIDVSSDVHVRRVFLRTGIIKIDSVEAAVEAASKMNPKYPGELDYPSWDIGRRLLLFSDEEQR